MNKEEEGEEEEGEEEWKSGRDPLISVSRRGSRVAASKSFAAAGRFRLGHPPPEAGRLFPAECRRGLHLRAGCRPGPGRGGAGERSGSRA